MYLQRKNEQPKTAFNIERVTDPIQARQVKNDVANLYETLGICFYTHNISIYQIEPKYSAIL